MIPLRIASLASRLTLASLASLSGLSLASISHLSLASLSPLSSLIRQRRPTLVHNWIQVMGIFGLIGFK